MDFSAISGRSMMKFESGYTVETVFDGSKLGIEPYSVEVTQSGELLVLDSVNSNIYRISLPLSRCEWVLNRLESYANQRTFCCGVCNLVHFVEEMQSFELNLVMLIGLVSFGVKLTSFCLIVGCHMFFEET